jgi:hypothetical protein
MAGLTVEDLVEVARRTVGPDMRVRDVGLLTAALARVEARALGEDVYPGVDEQAAALLHSLATTAPLEYGNRPSPGWRRRSTWPAVAAPRRSPTRRRSTWSPTS